MRLRHLVLLATLAASAAHGTPSYQLETLKYDVLLPKGDGPVRLFWEGEVANNTARAALISLKVLLLSETSEVLTEFPLPDVRVERLGKASVKQVFQVKADVWKKTAAIDGKAAPSKAEEDKTVEFYVLGQTHEVFTRAREFLKKNGIDYEEFDVDRDEVAHRRVQKKYKVNTYPVLVVGGKVFAGFHPIQWEEALGIEFEEDEE